MSAGEIVDIFNEDGQAIGTITREQAERDNHILENVIVFVFNSQGKVWAQLRAKTKKHYPAVWDVSACGAVTTSEHRDEAAVREMREEMGFDTELQYVEGFLNEYPNEDGSLKRVMSNLYIGVSDEQPQTNDEVDDFKLWNPDELRQDLLENPHNYVPSFMIELDKALAGRKNT